MATSAADPSTPPPLWQRPVPKRVALAVVMVAVWLGFGAVGDHGIWLTTDSHGQVVASRASVWVIVLCSAAAFVAGLVREGLDDESQARGKEWLGSVVFLGAAIAFGGVLGRYVDAHAGASLAAAVIGVLLAGGVYMVAAWITKRGSD